MINKISITVLIYNNFEFTVNHRGERISDSQDFHSITTALFFEDHNYEAVPLQQSM